MKIPNRNQIILIVVAVALILGNILGYKIAVNQVEMLLNERIELATQDSQNKITTRLEILRNVMYSATALFSASENVTKDEWHQFVEQSRIFSSYKGIKALGYVTVVKPENLAAFEVSTRETVNPDFKVFPKIPTPLIATVIYIEPSSDILNKVIGYNIYSDAQRREAVDYAIDNNSIAVTNKLILLADKYKPNPPLGVAMYVPVYRNGADISTKEQRRESIIGFITAGINPNDFMSGLDLSDAPGLKFQIFDDSTDGELSEAAMLFNSDGNFDYKPGFVSDFTKVNTIEFPNLSWHVRYTIAPAYNLSQWVSISSMIISIMLLLLSLILFLVIRFLLKNYWRAKFISTSYLKQLVVEDAVVDELNMGIIVTNESGLIIVFNKKAEQVLDYSDNAIKGKKNLTELIDPTELNTKAKDLGERTNMTTKPDFGVVITDCLIDGYQRCLWTFVSGKNELVELKLHIKPIYENRELIGYQFIF